MVSFDDPSVPPPADITGRDARAYEEKIVQLIRAALTPGSDPIRTVRSIELRGTRPDTEIVFRYDDSRDPGVHAVGYPLWKGLETDQGLLPDPGSYAGWIYSDWLAGWIHPIDVE